MEVHSRPCGQVSQTMARPFHCAPAGPERSFRRVLGWPGPSLASSHSLMGKLSKGCPFSAPRCLVEALPRGWCAPSALGLSPPGEPQPQERRRQLGGRSSRWTCCSVPCRGRTAVSVPVWTWWPAGRCKSQMRAQPCFPHSARFMSEGRFCYQLAVRATDSSHRFLAFSPHGFPTTSLTARRPSPGDGVSPSSRQRRRESLGGRGLARPIQRLLPLAAWTEWSWGGGPHHRGTRGFTRPSSG